MTTAYLGLDLHANSCTLGVMEEDGTYQGHQQFPTAESELVPRVASIEAKEKRLAVEASTLSRWKGAWRWPTWKPQRWPFGSWPTT